MYGPRDPMSWLAIQTHTALHQFHSGVGDRANALGSLADHSLHVSRIGNDFAISILKRLQVLDHHLGNLFFQVAIPHTREMRAHLSRVPTAQRLVESQQLSDARPR